MQRFFASALFTLFVASASAGCGKPPAKAPNATKPMPERRALEIIAKAVKKEKFRPAEGRELRVSSGGTLRIDVAVDDHKFGIAYLTEQDIGDQDPDRLPQKDPKRPKLLVVAEGLGKSETGTKVLVLWDKDYLYDDQVGEEHEQTFITAENSLERDVRDFLVAAKTNKWE